jgi:hypothetical protein
MQDVFDSIQTRSPFVVGADDRPRRIRRVGFETHRFLRLCVDFFGSHASVENEND